MNPLTKNWLFFPSLFGLQFAPTANHTMDSLLLATGFSDRKSLKTSVEIVQVGALDDDPIAAGLSRLQWPAQADLAEPCETPVPHPRVVAPRNPKDAQINPQSNG